MLVSLIQVNPPYNTYDNYIYLYFLEDDFYLQV